MMHRKNYERLHKNLAKIRLAINKRKAQTLTSIVMKIITMTEDRQMKIQMAGKLRMMMIMITENTMVLLKKKI